MATPRAGRVRVWQRHHHEGWRPLPPRHRGLSRPRGAAGRAAGGGHRSAGHFPVPGHAGRLGTGRAGRRVPAAPERPAGRDRRRIRWPLAGTRRGAVAGPDRAVAELASSRDDPGMQGWKSPLRSAVASSMLRHSSRSGQPRRQSRCRCSSTRRTRRRPPVAPGCPTSSALACSPIPRSRLPR